MNEEKRRLIGAMIGLARATDGSPHLITPESTQILIYGLSAVHMDAADQVLKSMAERVGEQKRKMVPNCFLCAAPCGKTSDFDISELSNASADTRDAKLHFFDTLCALAAKHSHINSEILYSGLIVIGMEDYTAEDILPIIRMCETQ